jgi:hypothetical protein
LTNLQFFLLFDRKQFKMSKRKRFWIVRLSLASEEIFTASTFAPSMSAKPEVSPLVTSQLNFNRIVVAEWVGITMSKVDWRKIQKKTLLLFNQTSLNIISNPTNQTYCFMYSLFIIEVRIYEWNIFDVSTSSFQDDYSFFFSFLTW